MNAEQLSKLRQIDIATADKDALVDIRSISIDAQAPSATRLQQFLTQIQNSYAYRVGGIAVKVEFAAEGKPLHDVLAQYLASLKNHT